MGLNLLGFDVGWSAERSSTAAAWWSGDHVQSQLLRSGRELPEELRSRSWDVVAIDAPIVPPGFGIASRRRCETALSLGKFQRRCKPGMSDIRGTGRDLRAAGGRAADQLERFLGPSPPDASFPRVRAGRNLVEAFPNAFLGVCVPGSAFELRGGIRRGGKFDWLYDRWIAAAAFEKAASALDLPKDFSAAARSCRNHDQRAALVCLMTAAAALFGRFTAVGERECGYFLLPPLGLWQPWAQRALDESQRRLPAIEVMAGSAS
jgi:predicted RNase H-like nuclease